jgi:hypothetical protein
VKTARTNRAAQRGGRPTSCSWWWCKKQLIAKLRAPSNSKDHAKADRAAYGGGGRLYVTNWSSPRLLGFGDAARAKLRLNLRTKRKGRFGSSLNRVGTPQFDWKSRELRFWFGGYHVRDRLGYDRRKKKRAGMWAPTVSDRKREEGAATVLGPAQKHAGKSGQLIRLDGPRAIEGRSRPADPNGPSGR